MTGFNLAQCNISRLKASLDDPSMKEFSDFLEPVNVFADQMEGFVWRLKGEYGVASSNMESVFEDEKMIINITIWKDVASLRNFTFNTVHNYFMKHRNKWMDKVSGMQFVMWWVPEGHIPTTEEAKMKLNELEQFGPGPAAFTWKQQYDCNGMAVVTE